MMQIDSAILATDKVICKNIICMKFFEPLAVSRPLQNR